MEGSVSSAGSGSSRSTSNPSSNSINSGEANRNEKETTRVGTSTEVDAIDTTADTTADTTTDTTTMKAASASETETTTTTTPDRTGPKPNTTSGNSKNKPPTNGGKNKAAVCDGDAFTRRQKRLAMNRESARSRRKRKNDLMESLTNDVYELRQKLEDYETNLIPSLRTENQELKAALNEARSKLANSDNSNNNNNNGTLKSTTTTPIHPAAAGSLELSQLQLLAAALQQPQSPEVQVENLIRTLLQQPQQMKQQQQQHLLQPSLDLLSHISSSGTTPEATTPVATATTPNYNGTNDFTALATQPSATPQAISNALLSLSQSPPHQQQQQQHYQSQLQGPSPFHWMLPAVQQQQQQQQQVFTQAQATMILQQLQQISPLLQQQQQQIGARHRLDNLQQPRSQSQQQQRQPTTAQILQHPLIASLATQPALLGATNHQESTNRHPATGTTTTESTAWKLKSRTVSDERGVSKSSEEANSTQTKDATASFPPPSTAGAAGGGESQSMMNGNRAINNLELIAMLQRQEKGGQSSSERQKQKQKRIKL